MARQAKEEGKDLYLLKFFILFESLIDVDEGGAS